MQNELGYDIKTSLGPRPAIGDAVSTFIAIRQDKMRGEWVIDHTTTGLRIVGVKTEEAARNVAESLAAAIDWSQVTGENDAELPKEMVRYISRAAGQYRVPKYGKPWPEPPKKKFTIDLSGSFTFNVTQLWPDGDWPNDPSIEDVNKLIEKEGGAACVIAEWNLDPEINVRVNPPR